MELFGCKHVLLFKKRKKKMTPKHSSITQAATPTTELKGHLNFYSQDYTSPPPPTTTTTTKHTHTTNLIQLLLVF